MSENAAAAVVVLAVAAEADIGPLPGTAAAAVAAWPSSIASGRDPSSIIAPTDAPALVAARSSVSLARCVCASSSAFSRPRRAASAAATASCSTAICGGGGRRVGDGTRRYAVTAGPARMQASPIMDVSATA